MQDPGFVSLKRRTGRGFKPHFAFRVAKDVTLGIDTSRGDECDHFLITHAHSDHAGGSAMLSSRSLASVETARSLEILYDREFEGSTFAVGDVLDLGLEVRTHDNGHTVGSTAYSWHLEDGRRVLVSGDVKDYSKLPRCDVLVCEATYGDPSDPTHVFDDEEERLAEVLEGSDDLLLGAYRFGKAQRAAGLLREHGYSGAIGMEEDARRVAEELMDVGPLCSPGEAPVNIVNPRSVDGEGYVLTGMERFYESCIGISDHLDIRGLMGMVRHCDPDLVLPYHPDERGACRKFARHVEREVGKASAPLHDLSETLLL